MAFRSRLDRESVPAIALHGFVLMDSEGRSPARVRRTVCCMVAIRSFIVRPVVMLSIVLLSSSLMAEGNESAARVDYAAQIKPLLKERCYACHGALKQEGGLRLDTAVLIRQGGDSGSAVVVSEPPENSLIIQRVSATDLSFRMPPEHEGEPLSASQVDLLKRWIAEGAPGPEHEDPESDPARHWSFLPIQSPHVPEPSELTSAPENWRQNPIDRILAARHQELGLTPQPEAPRVILLRRLYLDLIGVLPEADEIEAFESDFSPDWYEKAVDRLLNDPRYGERWARHWMDIWRYSDWWGLGEQLRNSQRHMWHWRDWIVESLNNDTPYDEMVRLMLAADELAPDDLDKLRATGFLARNYYIFNRHSWLDETVEHVSKSLLGLTMNCAKCHDHKYDPIDQIEYYRMRAFFEPYQVRMDMVPGEINLMQNGIPRVFDALLDAPTYRFIRGNESQPDQSNPVSPGVPALLEFDPLTIESITLPKSAWQPGLRPWVQENHLAAAKKRLQQAIEKRDQAAKELKASAYDQPAPNSPMFTPIVEHFKTLDQSRWKIEGEGWVQQDGTLEQTSDGPVHSRLTLLEPVPENFDAVFRFQILGGSRWRSVGLAFDTQLPGRSSTERGAESRQLVYLSGADSDSKVQGAYFSGDKWNYPREGRVSYPVQIGEEYTFHVRVRGSVVNVSVNGRHVLSWRTPLHRQHGHIQLTTFDALARFHEFRITPLDDSIVLQEPDSSSPSPQERLELTEADVMVATADLERVESVIAAMNAEADGLNPEQVDRSRRDAIQAERQVEVEKARRELIAARHALKAAAADKRADAEKKVSEAEKSLNAAVDRLQENISPEATYTPLQGAQWTATRFQFTGRDDPEVTFPATSTGRRTALARWITDPRNPLTARVAVNHLWGRHFGEPLVPTPFDFGRGSPVPALPELIDWMASELISHGWSMKHLHRMIVTSAAYRMSSSLAGAEGNLAKDPDNRFWWRRLPIRVESQVVRDSILSLAGTLDPTIGGPSVPPHEQDRSKRRSLYFFHSNNDRNLFLRTFDEAEVNECYRRQQSIVPQQALALLNSELVFGTVDQIAEKVGRNSKDDREFIQDAFLVLLGIRANDAEISACLNAMKFWKELPEGTPETARAQLITVLLNHNDFVTLR